MVSIPPIYGDLGMGSPIAIHDEQFYYPLLPCG